MTPLMKYSRDCCRKYLPCTPYVLLCDRQSILSKDEERQPTNLEDCGRAHYRGDSYSSSSARIAQSRCAAPCVNYMERSMLTSCESSSSQGIRKRMANTSRSPVRPSAPPGCRRVPPGYDAWEGALHGRDAGDRETRWSPGEFPPLSRQQGS